MSERFSDEVLQRARAAYEDGYWKQTGEDQLPHNREADAIAAMRKVLEEAERVRTLCPECGPNVKIDEDGCCTACGCDVAEVPPGAASDGLRHDSIKPTSG